MINTPSDCKDTSKAITTSSIDRLQQVLLEHVPIESHEKGSYINFYEVKIHSNQWSSASYQSL